MSGDDLHVGSKSYKASPSVPNIHRAAGMRNPSRSDTQSLAASMCKEAQVVKANDPDVRRSPML